MEDFARESDSRRIIDEMTGNWISKESHKKAYEIQERLKKEQEERDKEFDKKWPFLSVYEKMAYDRLRYEREKSDK